MGKTVMAVVGVAAAIGIAIAAPYLAPALVAALASAGVAVSVATATAIIGTTLSIGVSLAMRAIAGVPSARAQVGPPTVFRQAVSNSFIVYGKRRVGGLLVFFHSKMIGDRHWRYFVIAVAGHRCQGVVSWMLNDEIVTVDGSGMVTSGPHNGNAWLRFDRGVTPGVPDADFIADCDGKWTSNHRGDGVAKIYARFKLSDDDVEAGMPNITAIIEGKDDILLADGVTTGYTRNAILCAYDWMWTPREEGGFGAYADEIPSTAWIAAQAAVCDETVNSKPRYAIDAVITTGADPAEVRDMFVLNQAGDYTYSEGKHLIRPGYYVPPAGDPLSEDDLAGPIQVSPFLNADGAINEVSGTFISPEANYQAQVLPTQTLAVPPTDIRQSDVDLAFVTNPDQGVRILRIMLERAQREKTVIWPMNIEGLKYKTLDSVQLASTRYGLNNYVWKVVSWSMSADWSVVLSLREEDPDIYDPPSVAAPVTPPVVTAPTGPVSTIAQIQAILRTSYPRGLTISSLESGGSVTVTFSAFTMDYGTTGAVAVAGPTSLPGKLPSTVYYAYADVDAIGDATPTLGLSTTLAGALNSSTNQMRVYLNQAITTPAASSGGSSSGGGSGGGGYGGWNGSEAV